MILNRFGKLAYSIIPILRRLSGQPFDSKNGNLVIHCCHHRAGTLWFSRILKSIAKYYHLSFSFADQKYFHQKPAIILDNHSHIDLSALPKSFRGSHIIRDPREMIISGYYYHLWTKEKWANIPIKELGPNIEQYWPLLPVSKIGCLTYKEYLNSLNKEEGIFAEIHRASTTCIRDMVAWNYRHPNFLELRYEDLLQDEEKSFLELFKHYNFSEQAINQSLGIALSYSFKKITGRDIGQVKEKSHIRSGGLGQWKSEFSEAHKKYFKMLHGNDLINLGYEKDLYW